MEKFKFPTNLQSNATFFAAFSKTHPPHIFPAIADQLPVIPVRFLLVRFAKKRYSLKN